MVCTCVYYECVYGSTQYQIAKILSAKFSRSSDGTWEIKFSRLYKVSLKFLRLHKILSYTVVGIGFKNKY